MLSGIIGALLGATPRIQLEGVRAADGAYLLKKIDARLPHEVLLVLDATVGQNAVSQVEAFRHTAGVTGLVMTKLDGTARGGILVALAALVLASLGTGAAQSRNFARCPFGYAAKHGRSGC